MEGNIILVFILLYLNLMTAENCSDFKTCGECMGSPKLCIWCSDITYNDTRCIQKAGAFQECKAIVDFDKSSIKLIDNGTGHLMPQRIKAVIRPGEKLKFNFSYKPAKDHALDVYFLVDSSFTMEQHITKIQNQAKEIKTTLTKITNNVKFGIGTFVEKFALPYGDNKRGSGKYLFKNHLSLSEDVTTFQNAVKNIDNIGNLDIPEAGLDALMQVMVCKDIGWRPEARQIIIFATDSTYHSAGDGKMVGAYKPNDKKCHLDNNDYKREDYLTYDYPSINQINKIANEKGINIIFAVIDKVMHVYDALSKHIKRSECFELSEKSNLASVIKDQYTKLQQKMQLDYSSTLPKDTYNLYIDKGYDKPHYFDVKHSVTVTAELELTKCPEQDQYNLTIDSKDLHDEKLLIDIKTKCKCPCESGDKIEENSEYCNKEGTLKCGVCRCNNGRYGEKCECKGTMTTEEAMNRCRFNSTDNVVCSGRGTCVCGECKNCKDNYDGSFCEYSSRDCPYYGDEPCGGNGKCEKKVCKCYQNWTKADCSCTLDTNSCIGPNSKVCSGNGNCICGECECTKKDENGDTYKGKYCNYCDKCNFQRCNELENYVVCYHTKINATKSPQESMDYCDKEHKHLKHYDVRVLNKTELNSTIWKDTFLCTKVLDDKTLTIFKYKDDDVGNTLILIQEEKEPARGINYWIPVASSIGVVVLIGILTAIIWKVLVDIHDAREYEKFASESAKQGFDITTNPLYQSPATMITNPAYCNTID